jgi:hypothetical protein
MGIWTTAELDKIEKADELDLLSLRQDGSLRAPVTMWVVRVGDELFVRSVKGRGGPWFRGTQTRREGCIRSGGVEKDVMFVDETDPKMNELIDAAYWEKYRRYPKEYVDACLTPEAKAATLKLVVKE